VRQRLPLQCRPSWDGPSGVSDPGDNNN